MLPKMIDMMEMVETEETRLALAPRQVGEFVPRRPPPRHQCHHYLTSASASAKRKKDVEIPSHERGLVPRPSSLPRDRGERGDGEGGDQLSHKS